MQAKILVEIFSNCFIITLLYPVQNNLPFVNGFNLKNNLLFSIFIVNVYP